jgi:hypothetical protein
MARKPWEEMTFDEKMATVEEDFEVAAAERVQREMLRKKTLHESLQEVAEELRQELSKRPHDMLTLTQSLKKRGVKVTNFVHDEFLMEYAEKDAEVTASMFRVAQDAYGPLEARVLKQREFTTQEISLGDWDKIKERILSHGGQEEGRGNGLHGGDTPRPGLPDDEEDPGSR